MKHVRFNAVLHRQRLFYTKYKNDNHNILRLLAKITRNKTHLETYHFFLETYFKLSVSTHRTNVNTDTTTTISTPSLYAMP